MRSKGKIAVVGDERLNDIAQAICGQTFESLHPEHRVKIYDLALKESMAEDLYEIRVWFEKSKTFDGIQ
jgi:hypothetical protein